MITKRECKYDRVNVMHVIKKRLGKKKEYNKHFESKTVEKKLSSKIKSRGV